MQYAFSTPSSFPEGNRGEILGNHEEHDKKLPLEITQTQTLDEKGKCLHLWLLLPKVGAHLVYEQNACDTGS